MRSFASFGVIVLLCISAHADDGVSFVNDVRPILVERCQVCHSDLNRSAKFSVATAASLIEGGVSGPAIQPGRPDASLLIQSVIGDKPRMPKAGPALTPGQVATLRLWIEKGAHDDSAGKLDQDTWWSLRPLMKPPAPASHGRTPIDAFVQERLKKAGLTPSPAADRRTLIRRLYYDVHGLPPAPEEIDAFIKDPSPDAYDNLIDRLLDSPRYGERWARHWLDVVHYGDSHGYDKDKPRPNAWPYRDYVIDALNKDKPYARFVREQIAGDVLYPDDPQAFVATGFLAAGPWDFVGHQELREGTTEKNSTRLLDRDDMVATTISTFVSMTAHCARCHDHKFDPIPQTDYYNLQAVFAGIDRADRPYHEDPAVHRRLQQLVREKQEVQLRLQPLLDQVEFATSPEIVDLDSAIQDAGLQIAHIGTPKTPADAALKAELEVRRTRDRQRKKELVDAIVGPETYARIEAIQAELKALEARADALPEARKVYSGAAFFPRAGAFRPPLEPRPVFVLDRGSLQAPLKPAVPGSLTAVPVSFTMSDASEGSRRAALADWIADPANMLTWRSIVNRVWHYHFGAGLVDTPSDFGRMGSKPSHPELLDWLAAWFRDEAEGSLKELHRMILRSDVYRQQSAHRDDGAKVDAENRLLWRMNLTRLDAESVRDSVLSVAGKLDLTTGGPAVRWFRFKDDHSPVYDYARFDPDDPGSYRRSIYRFVVRSVPDPFMERLDCPDPSVLTPKRSTTLTAIQALTMMNNPFVLRMSEHLAERVQQRSDSLPEQVSEAVRLCFGRDPAARESEAFVSYAKQYGMVNVARLLFNSSEFLFVD
jgi:Protein of unknown function (DUF1549)/Protein of unknown function (DUF1553)/Planctomycete cytochrome C